MRRTGCAVVALVFGLLVAIAAPATADDPPPIRPPGVTDPGQGAEIPSGPTYVVTPGVGGSDLPTKQADPGEVKQQIKKDQQAAQQPRTPTARTPAKQKPGSRRPASRVVPGQDAVPSAIGGPPAVLAPTSSGAREARWLEIGSGALLLLVLTEFLRIRYRRPTG